MLNKMYKRIFAVSLHKSCNMYYVIIHKKNIFDHHFPFPLLELIFGYFAVLLKEIIIPFF